MMVGKANLHEFAWGITSENDHYGWVPNPAAPGRVAGGSSGGSGAALARGAGRRRSGERLRRLDPDPRRVLRRRRLQGDVRRGADRRLLPLAPTYDTAGPLATTSTAASA